MSRVWIAFLLCLVAGVALASPVPDAHPVILDQNTERLDISRQLSFYQDASSELNISQVIERWPEIGSSRQPDAAYNFGFTDSTYWFHTRVENRGSSNRRWVLEGLYPIIDEMELFVVTDDAAGDERKAGVPGGRAH